MCECARRNLYIDKLENPSREEQTSTNVKQGMHVLLKLNF